MIRKMSWVASACALFVLASCGSPASEGTDVATNSTPGPGASTPVSINPSPSRAAETSKTPLPAAEIAARSLEASRGVKSVTFDLDFNMSLDMPTLGAMTMSQTGTGSMNLADRQMDLNMTIAMDIPKQGKQNAVAEIIVFDNWLYMKAEVPGAADQWTKMKLTDQMWAAQSRFTSVSDLLESPVGVDLTGTETVRGIDCYILAVRPDMTSLSSWVASQSQTAQSGAAPSSPDLSQSLNSFSVKEWVAKDTLLPVKAVVSVSLNSEGTTPTQNTAMEMNVTTVFREYGKAVTIQLPAAAANAKELGIR